jgi:hypothetical protein
MPGPGFDVNRLASEADRRTPTASRSPEGTTSSDPMPQECAQASADRKRYAPLRVRPRLRLCSRKSTIT